MNFPAVLVAASAFLVCLDLDAKPAPDSSTTTDAPPKLVFEREPQTLEEWQERVQIIFEIEGPYRAFDALARAQKQFPENERLKEIEQLIAAEIGRLPQGVEDLDPRERLTLAAGDELFRRAALSAEPGEKREMFGDYLERTDALAKARPRLLALHLKRAEASLECRDAVRGIGAVSHLRELRVVSSASPEHLPLLGRLEVEGWLDAAAALDVALPLVGRVLDHVMRKEFEPAIVLATTELAPFARNPVVRHRVLSVLVWHDEILADPRMADWRASK